MPPTLCRAHGLGCLRHVDLVLDLDAFQFVQSLDLGGLLPLVVAELD
jgi:hypothetical protein